MRFNDYPILSEREYSEINRNYGKYQIKENYEMQEIINEMRNQINQMKKCNENGRYNEYIQVISKDISLLTDSIITKNQRKTHNPTLMQAIINKLNGKNRAITPNMHRPIDIEENVALEEDNNMRFHTIVVTSECDEQKKIITTELNIIRLLILHLNMNIHNVTKIAKVLENEYEILLSIIE